MNVFKLISFAVFWLATAYLVNALVAKKFKRVKWDLAVLYFMTVALIGIFGEIFLDTAYNYFVGHPLWRYEIFPIQNGYTSQYAIVPWGTVGFYLYLMHENLKEKWSISRTRHLALIFSLEALLIEALITLGAKIYLGKYLYYYLPSDLWHVSSLQNIPLYFICGAIIVQTIKRFRKEPVFFSFFSFCLFAIVIFMAK